MRSSICALALCCLAALATPAGAVGPDAASAKSYALSLPIASVPGAPLQRLQVPSQAMLVLQTTDFADLRVFNAEGQAVAMALAPPPAPARLEQSAALPAYPILGAPSSTGGVQNFDGWQLRIEEQQGKRVVQIGGPSSSPAAGAPQSVLGALIDARALKEPLVAIALDADLPVGQPTTLLVQTSKDLKTWSPLADTVVFRAQDAQPNLGSTTLSFQPLDAQGQYLRITWLNSTGQLAAVVLRSAVLTTSSDSQVRPRVLAAAVTPPLSSPHELRFALPFATPVAALRVSAGARNVLIPVRVFGRASSQQPWNLLASSVVFRLDNPSGAGAEQKSNAIELPKNAGLLREIKIEADLKTAGFLTAPSVQLEFEPAQLVFLASGSAPFTLAAGLAKAVNAFLPLQSLLPGYTAGQESRLPLAKVSGPIAAGSADEQATWVISAPLDEPNRRSWVLWAVLIAGALALGAMAWVLLKQGGQTNQPPQS